MWCGLVSPDPDVPPFVDAHLRVLATMGEVRWVRERGAVASLSFYEREVAM